EKPKGTFLPQQGGILCTDCGGKGHQRFFPESFWDWDQAGDSKDAARLASARKLLDEAFREYLER
ncbi:MAG: hypothetical protein R3257_02930, partial [bacterium]|nr:hypothetical protein [bacterium]